MERIALGQNGVELTTLVLGTAWFVEGRRSEVVPLLDAFVEAGGGALDTAQRYSDGGAEREIGRWMADRATLDRLSIVSKGGHPFDGGPSRLSAADIEADLLGSLERLGVTAIDVYLLHRDDPSVPAGHFVDLLEEHRLAGRIRTYGGSNWTTARLAEAAAHARAHDAAGFAASSPHLSLARWSAEPWPDTVTATDPESRAWYARHRLPLLAWSSQAAGWFAGAGRSNDILSLDGRRVFDTADNRERRRRAETLAAERGVSGGQVALAWVLNQAFPTAAVIGPRTVGELRENVGALEIRLSATELAWLDLDPLGGDPP
jgi:aryl-alcohol dehydrogenase-like predicted oxidoreductase